MLDPGTHEYSVFAGTIIADSYYHTQRRRTIRNVYVIDVGRRPDVTPTAAPLEDGPNAAWKADVIANYLRDNGPSSTKTIEAGTGFTYHSTRLHLRNNPDRFGRQQGRPIVWYLR